MRPESPEWKFDFADDLKLSENEVNDGIISTEEILDEGEVVEQIEQEGEDELPPELDIAYLKHVVAGKIEENVKDVVPKSGLVIITFNTQKSKDLT